MDKQFYFPWVRKGLGAFIDEKETQGRDGAILCRPELTVKSTYTARHNQPKEGEEAETSGVVLEKTVKFVGPGDILKINPSAVMKVHPEEGSEGFPFDYLPYIEFWEPDFLWRYTPASADEAQLRPWLALVTIKKEDLREFTPGDGLPYFSVDEQTWEILFPAIEDLVRSAHAQGRAQNRPDFCRLLGMRKEKELEEGTEYVALLIPAYETGRLRGLGMEEEDIRDIPAQRPSWDTSFSQQKGRKRGTDFPIYYKWSFKTGKESFDAIAKRLAPTGVDKSGLVLDVTDMGEGFSYNTVAHANARKAITMPAATKTIDFKEEPAFPAEAARKWSDEGGLYTNLKKLLGKSPVFIENQADIAGVAISEQDSEDPWVVPPVYGARHAMSTQLDDKEKPWLKELNMDVHHRAAAGLGRKVVQQHQEELMDRAWKQVEAVQALNNELYQRLLSIQANRALQAKTVDAQTDPDDNAKYIEYMMRYLSSMKNAGSGKYTLSSILKKAGIPEAFASPSFHNNAERLSKMVEGMDTTTLMDQIVKDQIFRFTEQEPVGAFDPKKIFRWCQNGRTALARTEYTKHWKKLLYIEYGAEENEDHSFSYKVSSIKPRKLFLTIKDTSIAGDTLNLSVTSPLRFIEQKLLDICGSSLSLETLKSALQSYSILSHSTYSRIYAMDDDCYQNTHYLSESGQGLFSVYEGRSYNCDCKALVIPLEHKRTAFGTNKTFVRWVGASFDLCSLEELQKMPIKYMTVYPQPGGSQCFYAKRSVNSKMDCLGCKAEGKNGLSGWAHTINGLLSSVPMADIKSMLAQLAQACRVSASAEEHERFMKETVITYYNENSEKWDILGCKGEMLDFLKELRSVLEANVGSGDLDKISRDNLGLCLGIILSSMIDYPNVFDLVAKKAFGSSAVATLCFLDKKIGPGMLVFLAHCLAGTETGKGMKSTFERIDEFILANPPYTVIMKSDYDSLLVIDGFDPSQCLSQNMHNDTYEERTFLDNLNNLALSIKTWQVKPNEETPKPIDDKAVTKLQEEVKNEDAYARMREIAFMYYKEFFADDEEGAKLRGEYLDKLLRSKYPILAYPFFPEPTYYYLKMISDKFIIPGLDEIPMDHIAMFTNNPTFTEAYLCGMNTEMGAELQWREYPTDRRGSYFRKFWDSESSVEAIRKDSFFDIDPVHLWGKTKLGGNHLDGKGNLLIFAIHSELFKLYPGTRVYLNKANSKLGFSNGRIYPVMETFVREDILLVGFKNVDVPDVIGNPQSKDYGYLLAFEQDLDDLNFFQTAENVDKDDSAAVRAEKLQDKVTIYGKHVSRFVTV